MKPPIRFSDQLREARKRAGLSQPKCEDALKLGTGQITAWETRRNTPHKIMQEGVLAKLWEIELNVDMEATRGLKKDHE